MIQDESARPRHKYVITHGSSQVEVTQVGGTLRSYPVDGSDVLDGFGIGERATEGRRQVLAPWPNRLTAGRYRYCGFRLGRSR